MTVRTPDDARVLAVVPDADEAARTVAEDIAERWSGSALTGAPRWVVSRTASLAAVHLDMTAGLPHEGDRPAGTNPQAPDG